MNQETKSADTHSHTCPWWFIFTFDNPIRRMIHDPEKMLAPYVASGARVLDVGCGMGFATIGLATLVGEDGLVVAVDLQEQMLAGVRKRAERVGVTERVQLHQCTPDELGVDGPFDFALAFWMVHEVGRPESFLSEIYAALRPGGKLLIAEPRIHVTSKNFERTVSQAEGAGFSVLERPQVRVSRAVLLGK